MTAIKSQNRLFSIVIPTWNNLAFLKLCIQSIQRNSYYNHQIIVHVNDGSDGTLEWIKKAGIDYTHSEQNIGVCFAMNMMRTKVKTDYILSWYFLGKNHIWYWIKNGWGILGQ